MSQSKNVYSNAFNFNDFMAGGVDARTGLYTCSLSLGALVSSGLNGPELPINLSFNPLGGDTGLGKGWSLALSRYDVLSKTLSLANGEVFNAIETPTVLVFEDMKLEHLKAQVLALGRYRLTYKNGQREELALYGTSSIAVSRQLFAANGASFSFEYELSNDQPVLCQVSDARRVLLSIRRQVHQVTLTQYPGSAHEAVYTLSLSEGLLTGITLPTGEKWALKYEVFDGAPYVVVVDSPLGAREVIGYKAIGQQMPNGSFDSIRSVSTHTIHPGQGQQPLTKTYKFSDTNFLGFGAGIDGSERGDALYRIAGRYQYTSTERLMAGGKVHSSTVRTYNKFHLLVSEVSTSGDFRLLSEIEYHELPSKSFSEQPAQLRLPKIQTLTYQNLSTGQSRKEVTYTDYDVAGNLLRKVEPSGITVLSTFYPAEGAQGCPADPMGFVRFERERTVIPAPGFAAAPTTITRFDYESMPGMEGADQEHVVCTRESLYEQAEAEQVLCVQTDFTYINDPQDFLRHGVVSTQSELQNGQRTQTLCSYSLNDTTLTLVRTLIGFDDTRTQQVQTLSSVNGLLLSEQNEGQPLEVFTYDALGRVLSETVAPGTDFEATRSSVYQAASGAGTPATLERIDVNGVRNKVTYDGLGRTSRVEEQDSDGTQNGPLREVYSTHYDQLGHCLREVRTDWLQGVPLALTSTFDLSANQQRLMTSHPDGRTTYSETDYVLMLEAQWTEGAGKSITHLNLFNKPERIEVFGSDGTRLSETVNVYDGLGRCISQTDPVGNCTTYQFDVFNRLCRSVLPDGHAVETRYAEHTASELPTEVTVAGLSLGQQVFDGLGRLSQSAIGGRVTRLAYNAESLQPSHVHTPSGESIAYTYERNVNEKITLREAADLSASYTYDTKLGMLLSCKEQSHESRFEYYPSGRLKREMTLTPDVEKQASHTYSLAGRPLTYTDVLGAVHHTTYGAAGLPVSFEHNGIKAELKYNGLGQIETVTAFEVASGRQVITLLMYDDLGREVSRRFESAGSEASTLRSRYTPASKLAQRTLTRGERSVRDERFSYDARGRLSEYYCSGTQLPVDAHGKQILKQIYVFDALDNIVTLETEFPEGKNISLFSYSEHDPTQLVGIEHSHPDYPAAVVLKYDLNGRLIVDEQNRDLQYDALGRLTQVTSAETGVVRGYHYDARDQLVELSQPSVAPTQRYYCNDRSATEINGDQRSSSLQVAGIALGCHQQGPEAKTTLFCTDQQHSVLSAVVSGEYQYRAYDTYGHCAAQGGLFSLQGFNGEQLDPLTGLYLLGNGYRAYSPALMRFQSPDSWSPFGAGGLNPYAYCLGDPINRVDPTGHWSWESTLGIATAVVGVAASLLTLGAATPLAIAGLALGAASAVATITGAILDELEPRSEAGAILGWVGMGLGLASAATGLVALGKAFNKFGNRLNDAFKPGLAGKGAIKAGAALAKNTTSLEKEAIKWKAVRPKPKDIVSDLGDVALRDYEAFVDAVNNENLHPKLAAKLIGDSKYSPVKGLKKSLGIYEIRIGGKDRVLFSLEGSTMTIMQVGGHI